MAEPERAPSPAPTSEAPLPKVEASTAPAPTLVASLEAHPAVAGYHPEARSHLRVPWLAALGATCGYFIGIGTYGELHPKPGEETNFYLLPGEGAVGQGGGERFAQAPAGLSN